MKVRAALLCLAMIATPAGAHDFWIQPVTFQAEPASTVSFTFQVGHGKFRDRWNNNQRVVSLVDFHRGVARDLRGQLRNGAGFDFAIGTAAAGLHLVAVQSSYSISELPAARFNHYAQEEGLVPILSARKAAGTLGKPGRERYSRRAKALVQVGPATAASNAYATRPIGLKLEIVPDRSPYGLGKDRILPVHVLYKGRRLANATVKLTNLDNDERPVSIVRTDRNGRARFRVPAGGRWLLNTIWADPVGDDPKVQFDTTFSSLTFGYERQANR
jgi:uncharacterized GH25 family protein